MSNPEADGGDEAAVVAEGPPPTQEWWSWGAGTEGQLATGDLVDHLSPQPLPSKTIISHIACGGAHAVALTDDGKVMSWGRGGCGQLGHGDRKNCLKPKFVEALEGITVCDVSAGWNHSGFVSDTGCLFTCGDGSFGQLGHGDYQSHCYPVQVQHVVSKHVTQIACGMRHSLALVKGPSENIVSAFGSGRRGQLGASLDGSRSSCHPVIVNELENHSIAHIYANGDHSAALSADGSLYTWGRGYSGVSDTCVPQMLDFPFKISEVALGWDHALLLTDTRELFMLGGIRHGMLSGPQQKPMGLQMPLAKCTSSDGSPSAPVLHKISFLCGMKVRLVSAGAEHSAVVMEDGTVMTWGWGEHGQLGLGDTHDQTNPRVVNLRYRRRSSAHAHANLKVYCGSGFCFVVRTLC